MRFERSGSSQPAERDLLDRWNEEKSPLGFSGRGVEFRQTTRSRWAAVWSGGKHAGCRPPRCAIARRAWPPLFWAIFFQVWPETKMRARFSTMMIERTICSLSENRLGEGDSPILLRGLRQKLGQSPAVFGSAVGPWLSWPPACWGRDPFGLCAKRTKRNRHRRRRHRFLDHRLGRIDDRHGGRRSRGDRHRGGRAGGQSGLSSDRRAAERRTVSKTGFKTCWEKGTVPICSEDCANLGQSPQVLKPPAADRDPWRSRSPRPTEFRIVPAGSARGTMCPDDHGASGHFRRRHQNC